MTALLQKFRVVCSTVDTLELSLDRVTCRRGLGKATALLMAPTAAAIAGAAEHECVTILQNEDPADFRKSFETT